MKNYDRSTKVLLLLLVMGIWGLLARPLVLPSPAAAQSAPKADTRIMKKASSSNAPRRYELALASQSDILPGVNVTSTDERGMHIGGGGVPYLSARQVQAAIHLASKSGWEVHSVVPHGNSEYFMVILEK